MQHVCMCACVCVSFILPICSLFCLSALLTPSHQLPAPLDYISLGIAFYPISEVAPEPDPKIHVKFFIKKINKKLHPIFFKK